MFALTHDPIDVTAVRNAVASSTCGAVIVFEGTTRDTFADKQVTHLAYEAYEAMAIPAMAEIGAEVVAQWPGARIAIIHRLGEVPMGETSVVIAVATPHRADAYAASRYAIDTLKDRVPIWKKEHYQDGSAWKSNASPTA